VSVKPFGAFVQIAGSSKDMLVHISQLANRRVETVEEVANVGDVVWVKVLPEDKAGRPGASMKAVDQANGEELSGGDASSSRGGGRRRDKEEEDVSTMTWGLQPLDRSEEEAAGEAPAGPSKPKVEPNYGTTGKLAEESNKVNGVVMKWSEPPDAAKPTKRWRLYVFKGKEALEPYHIHRQTAYLLGRERRIIDIPLDHPSCSSQHAVLQFRMTSKSLTGEDGETKTTRLVRPYVMDLGSTNGTYVNGDRVEAQRYIELFEKDCLRFGYSSREFVLLHDQSAS